MKHRLTSMAIVVAIVALIPGVALGQEVVDILASPREYADTEVVLRGELVGDFSRRGTFVWAQLNDDGYVDAPLEEQGLTGTNTGIGVRIPADLFDSDWGEPGRYDTRGPVVEITGVFRYQDPERSGETYIDASVVRLIASARSVDTGSGGWPLVVGGVMTVLGVGLLIARRETAPTGRRLIP